MGRLHLRLSLLMFLMYAVPGAWVPILILRLQEISLTKVESGIVCATGALGTILGPLLWGQAADRWLACERCISLCAACGGVLLWWAADATAFWPVFLLCLGHFFFYTPVFSLGASLTFRHLTEPEGSFGPIRMWGTVGWVAASLALALWLNWADQWSHLMAWLRPGDPRGLLSDGLRWGALLAGVVCLYGLSLPPTPPSPRTFGQSWRHAMIDAPLHAARLFRGQELAYLALCLFGVYLIFPFSTQMLPLVIQQIVGDKAWVPATLTVAQISEVATLATLPWILRHLRERRTMLLGLGAWVSAMSVLALGRPPWLVIGSLLLHGVFICCFLVAGQLAINRRAAGHFRASAQALMQWIAGLGMLVGNVAAGTVQEITRDNFAVGFGLAALVAGILTIILTVGFRPTRD